MIIPSIQTIVCPLSQDEVLRYSDLDSVPVPLMLENQHPTNTLTCKPQQSPTGASGSFVDMDDYPQFTLAPAGSPDAVKLVTFSGTDQFVRLLVSGGADGAVGAELIVADLRRKTFNGNMSKFLVG